MRKTALMKPVCVALLWCPRQGEKVELWERKEACVCLP
jgi:hypothetical protein